MNRDVPTTIQSHPLSLAASEEPSWSQLNWLRNDYDINSQLITFHPLILKNPLILKYSISLVWCHLTKLLRHLIMIITSVPNFHHVFILPQSNLCQDMNLFYLHLSFLFRDDRRLTFPIWFTFPLKYFSKLKDTWTIRHLTELNNEIFNTINHPSNYFTDTVSIFNKPYPQLPGQKHFVVELSLDNAKLF